MKKVALVFVLAVLAPSLVLAWLALRSLRDQQFLLERQQSLLNQRVTDSLARDISDYLAQKQQDFSAQVESLAVTEDTRALAATFDDKLRQAWPLAEVGFCVTAAGKILAPQPNARTAAQMFRLDNSGFLGNREPVEVYLTANNAYNNFSGGNASPAGQSLLGSGSFLEGARETKTRNQMASSNTSPSVQAALGGGGGGGNLQGGNLSSSAQPASTDNRARIHGQVDNANSGPNSNSGQSKPMVFAINNSANIVTGASEPAQENRRKVAADTAVPPPVAPVDTLAVSQPPARQEPAPGAAPVGRQAEVNSQPEPALDNNDSIGQKDVSSQPPYQAQRGQSKLNYKTATERKVSPQNKGGEEYNFNDKAEKKVPEAQDNLSKAVPAEAEFRQLIGDQPDGMLARFLQNKLKLMCWHRLSSDPDLIFGAQLDLSRVIEGLRGLVGQERPLGDGVCLAILDDNARPVVVSRANFQANWKRPFVATEVGDALPHWEVAAYLLDPRQLLQAAQTAKITLALLVAVLLVAIGVGSLLIVRGLETELKLARQKTDFVSNVSHELKTPLTSIRMFSELLAEGRVADAAKQRSYLHIITAEAGRLTRLINNVLDFSRMERGEKKYDFQPCDMTVLARSTAETLRPHLEGAGFQFKCELPPGATPVRGDADALSQVIVNLLSNAEKYSAGGAGVPGREILLQLAQKQAPLPHVEVRVLDRGPGVPRGSEEKIFEKFYRAHDSLSSGIQGSGLGLTIARQIARAHGGDVVYEPREGGGSCFMLRLPVRMG